MVQHVWGGGDRGGGRGGGEGEQGVVLHDGVEGVVVRGGGGGAHVFRPQCRQPQRLRRARLRVQGPPQVQHLTNNLVLILSTLYEYLYSPLSFKFCYADTPFHTYMASNLV